MQMAIKGVHKKFGDLYVLKNLIMEISARKIISILGPSGCGKTTLLNLISGTLKADAGEVIGFKDEVISYLFQEPRLLKWKTVRSNIEFTLKDVMRKTERATLVNKYIDMVGLAEFADYYPEQLSGGMRQRVAIARSFAYPSDILLMDEPFKSLDIQLKSSLMKSLINLWSLDRRTVLFVTHDIHEALLLGDEIYILTTKPTAVKTKLTNNIPLSKRDPQNKQFSEMEKKVCKMLFN